MNNPWFQTHSGVEFHLLNPVPEEVVQEDLAHHLSQQCRFNGACNVFYSVAEHSVRVMRMSRADRELRLALLLHDAHEAYIGDLVRPMKVAMGEDAMRRWDVIEGVIQMAIHQRFNLPLDLPSAWRQIIKDYDNAILLTEKRDLFSEKASHIWGVPDHIRPMETVIRPWRADEAKEEFLRALRESTK